MRNSNLFSTPNDKTVNQYPSLRKSSSNFEGFCLGLPILRKNVSILRMEDILMTKNNRSEQILRDIRKVNMKVDTFINEVHHNIAKTNKELAERKKAKQKAGF